MIKITKTYDVEVLINTFTIFKEKINQYKYPEDLFGDLIGNSIDDKLAYLKTTYIKLLQDYSADKYSHYNDIELFNTTSEIARKIIEFEKLAEEQILNNTYGTKNNSFKTFSIIKGKEEYKVFKMISREDYVDIFDGEFGDYNQQIFIKMARNADDNGYLLNNNDIDANNETLLNEVKILNYINSINNIDFNKVKKLHYPIPIDEFKFEDRQVSVTRYENAYDLIVLKEKFPKGIPLYHGLWILDRALSALGYLHYNNILIGTITPSGINIIPKTHNLKFTDFTSSILNYISKDAKYKSIDKNYTAPEINSNTIPNTKTDMYSLGMNMLYILGGNVENKTLPNKFVMLPNKKINTDDIERIRDLILLMINKNPLTRLDDAWKTYHLLRTLRSEIFKNDKFTEFIIPK